MELLRPHQQAALRQLQDGKILWGGVGTGKSRVALAYYEQEHRCQDIYVVTTAKKRDSKDWEGEAAKLGVGKQDNATVHGVLTVDSWNNIQKYKDVKNAFFVFDEQRLVGSGSWVRAFQKIARNNSWILLSATPGDTWMDYVPVFVGNGFFKNRTEFIREHVVFSPFTKFPKVDRYVGVNKLVKLRNQILVHMPFEKETVRHSKTIKVDYDQEKMEMVTKKRWHIYEERPIRDIAEVFAVGRRLVNTDPSRLRAMRRLLKAHPKLIVFYNHNPELELLRRLKDVTTVAEWNGHKHEEIPDTDSWVYLVQYAAGSESWNCTDTDAIAFFSLTYSYKMWEQAHGRIDRMNTGFRDLWYYTVISDSIIDKAIRRSLKAKKNFQPTQFDESEF
jgi:hypothetical protein